MISMSLLYIILNKAKMCISQGFQFLQGIPRGIPLQILPGIPLGITKEIASKHSTRDSSRYCFKDAYRNSPRDFSVYSLRHASRNSFRISGNFYRSSFEFVQCFLQYSLQRFFREFLLGFCTELQEFLRKFIQGFLPELLQGFLQKLQQ